MENKEFDKVFQSLKDREITPSSNALKQLQDGLNEADKKDKKKKTTFIWWVAASIVILLSVGISVITTEKSEDIPATIAYPDAKSVEKSTSEELLPSTQLVEVDKKSENLKLKEEETYSLPKTKTAPKTRATIQVIANRENEKAAEIDKEEERIAIENELLQDSMEQDKRLAELLKPVDDAELDALLQQEKVTIALEEIDDTTIMQLLREAQMELHNQVDTQLASSQADRLMLQAEAELRANRSLRNIFNKAIETGVVQVEALFNRE